jgi:hypothetical protein
VEHFSVGLEGANLLIWEELLSTFEKVFHIGYLTFALFKGGATYHPHLVSFVTHTQKILLEKVAYSTKVVRGGFYGSTPISVVQVYTRDGLDPLFKLVIVLPPREMEKREQTFMHNEQSQNC